MYIFSPIKLSHLEGVVTHLHGGDPGPLQNRCTYLTRQRGLSVVHPSFNIDRDKVLNRVRIVPVNNATAFISRKYGLKRMKNKPVTVIAHTQEPKEYLKEWFDRFSIKCTKYCWTLYVCIIDTVTQPCCKMLSFTTASLRKDSKWKSIRSIARYDPR